MGFPHLAAGFPNFHVQKAPFGFLSEAFVTIYNPSFFFFFFTAISEAYASSQVRVWIGAAAEAYTTATETPDPSRICDLHSITWQYCIFNLQSKARDWTQILAEETSGP